MSAASLGDPLMALLYGHWLKHYCVGHDHIDQIIWLCGDSIVIFHIYSGLATVGISAVMVLSPLIFHWENGQPDSVPAYWCRPCVDLSFRVLK